ncbi:MAG TPA: ABC transporter permease [Chloroflexota bacterium]|jgi:peptide/nickel transport system permease protein
MFSYIIKRILLMIPTLFGVALITFVLLRMVPGDIVQLKLAGDGGRVDENVLQQERARLGLDKPVALQFIEWTLGAMHFDFGLSMWTGRPIVQEVGIRLELSLQLCIMATIIATMFALPLGAIAALKQDTWVDYAIRLFSIGGLALPGFWVGIITILGLLVFFRYLPPLTFTSFLANPAENLSMLIWPALTVGYRYSAVATRMTRSTLLEVMRDDYVRTARAKGVAEQFVVLRHAMRNALLPVVTVIGLEFAFLLGGLLVTEQVFNLNGIGKLMVDAVVHRDYTMTQALIMLIATTFVVINFLIDLLYVVLDPRISYS